MKDTQKQQLPGLQVLMGLITGAMAAGALAEPPPATQPGIEEVVVTAHQREYRMDSAESALGLDLTIMQTPAAVSVITADLLQDQQVNNIDEALRNVAGVTKYKTGNGGEEKFSIRGFDASQSIYKDGARINNPLNASNIPSTETANIERIEVLKGSSALLYGQGEPGGVINYITKRPQLDRSTTLEVLGGSDNFKKLELDTTGAFGQSETLAYRLVVAYQDADNFRDEVFRERLLVNPSLAYIPSDTTRLMIGYESIDDDYTQDRGQVLDGNNPDGYFYSDRIDASQFMGIPGWNRQTTAESSRLYLIAEHQVTHHWRVEATINQTDNDKVNFDSTPIGISNFDLSGSPANDGAVIGALGTPVANLVAIQARKTDGEGETRRYSIKNIVDFSDRFGFEHQVLASVSHEDFLTESTSFRAESSAVFFNVATEDYFSLNYAPIPPDNQVITVGALTFDLRNRGARRNQEYQERGVNVLDYIRFNEQWAWLIGGRYSEYKDTLIDFDDNNLSARTGVVYSINNTQSLYASYSEGYTNSAGRLGQNNQGIDPETSTSWELGGKWQLLDDNLLLTATLYRTEKNDVAYIVNPTAPDAEQFFGNFGSIRSQGLELEAVGFIREHWRIQAGYTYIDNEITEGGADNFGNQFPQGNTLGGVAEHNFNLFSFYEFAAAAGYIGVGGGVYYQGEVYVSAENRAEYDAWTQLDLATYYKQDAWKLQLNATNITDEEYRLGQALTSADIFAAGRVGTATPRSLIASIAYEF